jgi:hypothetical protein
MFGDGQALYTLRIFLDLVLTTNENLVHKVNVMNGMSDHQMIIATINARPKIIRNKPRKVYLYKKGNLDAAKEYLDSKLESFKEKYKEMNIEVYWTTFKSHLFNAMDQYIPSKTLISRWNIHVPWINQNIKKMIRKKERLYKAAKRYQTEDHWKMFNNIEHK